METHCKPGNLYVLYLHSKLISLTVDGVFI